ncbi:MAG: hypothetical protein K9M51_02645 [Candidatus Gracilibacteria bacterium]|nr:hypothetical protein [Candidatus Gracilibacteria bacterium]
MKKLFKIWSTIAAGYFLGLLFAQRPGRELRSRLKQSKTPLKDLGHDVVDSKMEMWNEARGWVESSEHIQQAVRQLRVHFDELAEKAESLGEDAGERVQAEFERLSQEAKEAAGKLKTSATKKAGSLRKSATKRAGKASKRAKKEVKTVARKIKK